MGTGKYIPAAIREMQLMLLLRGAEFISVERLAGILKVSEKTIQRCIEKINHPELEESIKRKTPKEKRGHKSYRIYDPSEIGNPEITEPELIDLYENIFNKKIGKELSDKLLKIITISQVNNWYVDQAKSKQGSTEYKKIVKLFKKAIKRDKAVLLLGYHSRNDGKINNKVISPVKIDEPGRKIFAIDEEGKRSYYKFENIDTVEILARKREDAKNWDPLKNRDVFGFLPNDDTLTRIHVRLILKRFARSQLMTQFPQMVKYLKSTDEKSKESYLLEIDVYDIEPIARFVTGLFNEITIEGSEEAKNMIKAYYHRRVAKGYENNFTNNTN